jgi:hypothetical protein
MICPTEKAALDQLVALRARPLCLPHAPLRMQWDDELLHLITRLWNEGLEVHRRDYGHAPRLAAEYVVDAMAERVAALTLRHHGSRRARCAGIYPELQPRRPAERLQPIPGAQAFVRQPTINTDP